MKKIIRLTEDDLTRIVKRIISEEKKSKHTDYYRIYGGKNKKNPPFEPGTKIKRKWRVDDDGEVIKDGREMYEFVRMDGNVMKLRPLNKEALYSQDTTHPEYIKKNQKAGYKPRYEDLVQLHYNHADAFEVVS
jgi:hypothetical protein